jgi:hypothetical protein
LILRYFNVQQKYEPFRSNIQTEEPLALVLSNVSVFADDIFDSNTQCSGLYAFAGKGQSDTDAASIKTAHPIPAACGVFYFEITVEDKGADGYGSSGFKPDLYQNGIYRVHLSSCARLL